jgi:hypothetical protein
MLVSFINIAANVLLLLVILKLIEVHLLRKNPDSTLGQAIAFLVG